MSDSIVSTVDSFLGPLRLRWIEGKLAGVLLPSAPPVRIGEGQEIKPGEDWCDILNLRGISLAMKEYGAFPCLVWRWTMTIPFGQTRSYGWIAAKIGNPGAARATGRALGKNPWPLLVPCHRVIRADGTIGGFSSGVDWKRFLLKWERGYQNIRGSVGRASGDQGTSGKDTRKSGDQ